MINMEDQEGVFPSCLKLKDYRAVKLGKGRIFRPLQDIYSQSDILEGGVDAPRCPDLWSMAQEGGVDELRGDLEGIKARAKEVYEKNEMKKRSVISEASRGSRTCPPFLLSACPSDTKGDLLEVALNQRAWSCVSCSHTKRGFTICCLWCAKKCHAGHLIRETTSQLPQCDCGTTGHEPPTKAVSGSDLDLTDGVGEATSPGDRF